MLFLSLASLPANGVQTNMIQKTVETPVVEERSEKKDQKISDGKLECAIQVAETELERQYGARVLNQRPWIVSMSNDCYVIKGNPSFLMAKNGKKMKGGLATIVVDKNMKVVRMSHGK